MRIIVSYCGLAPDDDSTRKSEVEPLRAQPDQEPPKLQREKNVETKQHILGSNYVGPEKGPTSEPWNGHLIFPVSAIIWQEMHQRTLPVFQSRSTFFSAQLSMIYS